MRVLFGPRTTERRRSSSAVSSLFMFAAVGLLCGMTPVTAEVQDFAILLPPTDMYIHYADGYLRGPGATINLSDLTFKAVSQAYGQDDGLLFENNDDAAGAAGAGAGAGATGGAVGDDEMAGDDGFGAGAGGGGRRGRGLRRSILASSASGSSSSHLSSVGSSSGSGSASSSSRQLDGGVEVGASQVDIVAFELPAKCANSRAGCDWTTLGVGAKTEEGTLRWCCSQDSIDLGLCTAASGQLGRLLIQESIFVGERRAISVPQEGDMAKKLKNGILNFDPTGRYVVVFANCDEHGREIMVSGNAIWKSKHGYLPGELFGFMYFYTLLFAIYAGLFIWYANLMRINEASRIPIEKWILMTIVLGLIELLFRTADYWSWNEDGVRSDGLTYMGIFFGVLKYGTSWSLVVMVSLGWGVVRDSLGPALYRIIVLGVIYIGVAAARDLMIIFAVHDMQTLSYDEEVELFDAATILTFVVVAICVIFIMWILDALNGTMQYLENMSQSRKLQRYLKLRTILLFSILFATIWAVFSLVDTYDEDGIVREEHEWIVDAATEVNYLFVLIGVSILWKPNPSAKEYAFVMELATGGGDGETELELTGGVVPSALDDDDEPTGNKEGNVRTIT